ncbi:SDR family NAD(P)-dependent oxidoreductase [Glaciibacter sp. 2TAF33]|uniref:SDR family NAD(P)-dependent oxidoreductase n=1 Tax=Glaciibacter sp. 2TAF33 TaxID=3233015 RepID=UPI003F9081CB
MLSPLEIFSLKGRTAVLTGASAGLGRRFADVLAGAGAHVAVVARRVELLDSFVAAHAGSIAIRADLARPDDVDGIVERVRAEYGTPDIIVNNAAYIAGGVKAEDETAEQITSTLNVNLVSPIRLVQAFQPGMRERGTGSIVNVTSMVASVGIGRFPQAVYSASKGGLESITREWAAQWSRYGIRVNAIAPGFFESEITKDVIGLEKVQQWILQNTLLPRHGTPEDFDGALLYLASDASRYVTGQTLTVDGGWTAH